MIQEFQEAVHNLSHREREVLSHIARGDTYTATAHRMNVSPHTVDTYLRRIRAKTGARSRVHLLLLALSLTSHSRTDAAAVPVLPDPPGAPGGEPRPGF
ncbi:helix-turn-helix transcriptional regulator [Streptomyces sp. NPDC047841]|uniref:response regulator transcription factor n=1 Tax=Streptomyces sp. NPDC047841 TaxID=3154708 RepID=UPI0034529CF7